MADSRLWGFAAMFAAIILGVGGFLGAFTAGSPVAVALWGASLGFGTIASVIGAREARKAANASLQDRITTIRSTDEPRAILYGRGRTGGVLLYASPPYGARKEKVALVIGLVGHPCESVDQIWLNDERVQLDASGYVIGTATGKWRSRITDYSAVPYTSVAIWDPGTPSANLLEAPDNTLGIISVSYVAAAGDLPTTAVAGVDYDIAPNSFDIRNLRMVGDVTVVFSGRFTLDGYIRIKSFTGRETGTARQDTELRDALATAGYSSEYDATATFDGIARLSVEMSYEPSVFADGVPNFSATMSGMRVYDPRSDSTNGGTGTQRYADPSTWTFSRNAALCTAHYVMTEWGFNVGPTRIDWPAVITAANKCAEQIQIHPTDVTFTDYQFTVDGFLSTQSSLGDNLDELAAAMNGFVSPVGASWRILAGGWTAPAADAILTDAHVVASGDAELFAFADAADLFNCVRGRYRDETTYEITDMPPYVSDDGIGGGYVPIDNDIQIWRDIDMPLTLNSFRAQRLAKQILHRHRAAVGFSATFSLAAWRYQVGNRLRLRLTAYGWDTVSQDSGTGKVFMVIDRAWAPPDTVRMALVEDGSAIYSASHSEFSSADPTPNTSLPSSTIVAAPTNFEGSATASDFFTTPDGQQIGFVLLTWDAITDASVLGGGWLEIDWMRLGETDPRTIRVSPFATEYRLDRIYASETLIISIRAVNASMARSSVTGIEGLVNGVFVVSDAFLVAEGVTLFSGNALINPEFRYGTQGWALFVFTQPTYTLALKTATMPAAQRVQGPPAWNVMIDEQGLGAVAPSSILCGLAQAKPVKCAPGETWAFSVSLEHDGCDAGVGVAYYRADDSYIEGSLTLLPTIQKPYYVNAGLRSSYVRHTVYSGDAPADAFGVRGLVYKYGTRAPNSTSRLWVLEPDLREYVGAANNMPPFSPGVPGSPTVTVLQPYNSAGTTLTPSTVTFADHALGTAVAEGNGTVDIKVTLEVVAKAYAGYTNTITVGIYQNSKRSLVSRQVLSVSDGTNVPQHVYIEAQMTCVAGETIAPILRMIRSHYGVGTEYNATDKMHKIEAAMTFTYT